MGTGTIEDGNRLWILVIAKCWRPGSYPWPSLYGTYLRATDYLILYSVGLSLGSVLRRRRCTFTGGVEIARLLSIVQLSMLTPVDLLEEVGLADTVRTHYETQN